FGKNCKEVVQHLSIRNDKHPEVSYDMLQMIFVILPRFRKNESECKTVMDKILFAFKNGHKLKKAPKSFKEKELKDIFNIAEISNFTESELYKYEAVMRNEYDQRACIAYAKKEGEVRGETKGLKKVARNMLARGFSVADVLKATDLPREQIRALSKG
ncbi:MAG: PD-(D/E)XK nuclease family transposase, partial [Fibromonadales bacterium]|nr:PD-(D/E)XK nuclease family transposase [Fibromonadales bacterium]